MYYSPRLAESEGMQSVCSMEKSLGLAVYTNSAGVRFSQLKSVYLVCLRPSKMETQHC